MDTLSSAPDTSGPSGESPHADAPVAAPVDETGLIESHLHLVRQVVDRIKLNLPAHIDADDLHSVGIIGLISAVRKFSPVRGRTFAGYAVARIRGAVLDELRRMDWCSRRARAFVRELKAATNAVEQRAGRAATESEIRATLGLPAGEYAKWIEESKPVTFIAFDQERSDATNAGISLHEVLADENDVTGRDNLDKSDMRQLLAQGIAALPEIPRQLLAMYYFEGMRMSEIGAVFKLTESRICRIRAQTLHSLRAFLERTRDR